MSALDYDASKWVAGCICDILNEWFEGIVQFEVDSYYTTQTITDASFPTRGSNWLFATQIEEVFDVMYLYHNTITTVGYGKYDDELRSVTGLSVVKNASLGLWDFWESSIVNNYPLQEHLSDLKADQDIEHNPLIECYMHEFAHSAEQNYDFDYDLHTALSYPGKGPSNMSDVIKPYLLGEFEMDGEMCGIPMDYWKHQNMVTVNYVAQSSFYGRVKLIGEGEDDAYESGQSYITKYIAYGTDLTVEAIPQKGYRFVKWTDGVTTAVRHDINIIAYISVKAIFEKI